MRRITTLLAAAALGATIAAGSALPASASTGVSVGGKSAGVVVTGASDNARLVAPKKHYFHLTDQKGSDVSGFWVNQTIRGTKFHMFTFKVTETMADGLQAGVCIHATLHKQDSCLVDRKGNGSTLTIPGVGFFLNDHVSLYSCVGIVQGPTGDQTYFIHHCGASHYIV
jgi:hypothetical protein